MPSIIELESAERTYTQGDLRTQALRPTTLAVQAGTMVAVTGRSGSGKSTFLNLVSGIDRPTGGHVRVAGTDLGGLNESRLSAFRGGNIGIVFQFFELIPTLTALENVMLAMDLVGKIAPAARRPRALDLLGRVGLAAHARKLPSRLSGGEQQRTAIARALANDPPIVVADEPSGNLDTQNAGVVLDLFRACANEGRTVVVATHEQSALSRYDRVLRVVDGAFEPEAAA